MKKLMIAAAVVCAAAVVQAASVTWGSGTCYAPTSSSGGWSTTTKANGVEWTMTVYQIAAENWTADGVASMTQAQLFDYVKDGTKVVKSWSGDNWNSKGTALTPAVTISDPAGVGADVKMNLVLVANYSDATYGNMYMATATPFETSDQGIGQLANQFSSIANWQAVSGPSPVPEPTSGLLLLLGVAGLALKRKRA